jgi:NAD(P)-dependent dehydrogenase (short-subunit alcohol dehydrogenase family)
MEEPRVNESEGLPGRAALVTGGSLGLGRATALTLAAAGVNVAVVARGSADLEESAEHIRARSGGQPTRLYR